MSALLRQRGKEYVPRDKLNPQIMNGKREFSERASPLPRILRLTDSGKCTRVGPCSHNY